METQGETGGFFTRRFDKHWLRPSWWNMLVALPWAIGLSFLIYEGLTDRAIAQREKAVQGIITSHEPANHNRYGYTFSANDKSYSGWEIPRRTEPTIGQSVVVYYDPDDPHRNSLTNFADLSLESFGPMPLLMFGIRAAALFIRGQRRSQPSSES